ncbi:MAG TPA: MarR family transcriptional regulator [Jiangellales bacterium]|nr:MarR family transcriptional regulator [Jiangellales bacterium]
MRGDAARPAALEETWTQLTSVVAAVGRALDAEVAQRVGLLVSECEVLAAAQAPPRDRATMSELGAAARLSASGVTRVVGRLEALGLLERYRDAAVDNRLLWVRLTAGGRERLDQARAVRARVLARELAPRLPALHALLAAREPADIT